jgi:hypothetical protein
MLLHPPALMAWCGFDRGLEPFFVVQNGVFHFVLAAGYALAAVNPCSHRSLVLFAIVAKSMAMLFLVVYWIAYDPRWVIVASGAGDGGMALAVGLLLRAMDREHSRQVRTPPQDDVLRKGLTL